MVDVVSRSHDDTGKLQADILGQHVEHERVRHGLLLSRGDRGLVTDGCQVADDGGGRVDVGAQVLSGVELACQEGNGDGLVLVVGHLDDRLGRPAIDKLDTEDVGFGEGANDVGLQLGNGCATGILIKRLQKNNNMLLVSIHSYD